MTFIPVPGEATKLGIGASTPVTQALSYLSDTLDKNYDWADMSGNRGQRSRADKRTVNVGGVPGGSFTTKPNQAELAAMLTYLRSAVSAGSYAFAESLTAFAIQQSLGATLHSWTGCKAAGGVFSAQSGDALQLVLSLLATGYAPTTASFPAITHDETTRPWMYEDLVLTVNSVGVDCLGFRLSIDTGLRARKANALLPSGLYPTEDMVEWSLTIPYGDTPALFDIGSSVPVSAVFTSDSHILTLSSPKVKFKPKKPAVSGRDEVLLELTGNAKWNSAAGDELAITIATVP